MIPEHQLAYEDSTVYISCVSVSQPKWFKNKKKLKKTGTVTKSIVLHHVKESDSGIYTCEGEQQNRKKFTARSELLVGGKRLLLNCNDIFKRNHC